MTPRRSRSLLRIVAAAAAALVIFTAGLLVGGATRQASAGEGDRYRALDLFAQVFAAVENLYVDDVPSQTLAHGAIEGLVRRLDAHSAFLAPDVYRAMKDDTAGEFEGVGLELGIDDSRLVVMAPLDGSPGARAGIVAGDQLVAIDGVATAGVPLAEAARRLKGRAGTAVRLRLERDGSPAREVMVVRERVQSDSVEWRVADAARGVVVVRIRMFHERTDRNVERALAAARKALGRELGGLVLDVRSNPGGLLDEAVKVADRFLRDGLVVTTEGRGQRAMDVERAHDAGTEPDYPMAVVVDGGTASASEILAAALQDHHRASIVGARTFGKGTVQQIVELGDGSGLKLTVARYFSPEHRSIQDSGVTPDIAVSGDPVGAASADAALPVVGASRASADPLSKGTPDMALDAAVAHVASKCAPRLH